MGQRAQPAPVVAEQPSSPKLLDRVRAAIRARHYSLRTEEAYTGWIRWFIVFHHKRHPVEMGEPEINQFLMHLAVAGNVAASTQNQALSAIVFLYQEVLEVELDRVERVVFAKKPRRLPEVLTREEVRACLNCMSGTPKIVALLLYGAGLRLLEALRLRVKGVDFTMNQIVVRDGKGQKDRITMLPAAATRLLVDHLLQIRRIHEADLRRGYGRVYLPGALAEKYPSADRQWGLAVCVSGRKPLAGGTNVLCFSGTSLATCHSSLLSEPGWARCAQPSRSGMTGLRSLTLLELGCMAQPIAPSRKAEEQH